MMLSTYKHTTHIDRCSVCTDLLNGRERIVPIFRRTLPLNANAYIFKCLIFHINEELFGLRVEYFEQKCHLFICDCSTR